MSDTQHASNCECRTCRPDQKVATTIVEWHAQHDPHGPSSTAPFPHASGTWSWLVCPCGARYLVAFGK